ncbi:restriction endonuclease subunit S [Idiomarina sp. PL1-037]|uniref:restriction endonuclease subunit S n=1 Tax=Idiomarina sp. PL1-037 TaxID=3095365 RepID=UPI002ACC11EA|nr:restriction endonuclease subunit S [Idiomarina sp. PL1-037]WQC52605.1 restriction endonuclease subunit S [Idiomarina sp. PL1-037]
MGCDWPVVRLGDHVNSCLGKMLDKKKNKGVNQPYLGNSNVRWGEFDLSQLSKMKFEEHEAERYGIEPGDLIVCEGGEPGRCAIWNDALPNMKIQKALHRVRTNSTLNNHFLYYWFLHAGKNGSLEPYFTGTTIKHLTGKALNDLELSLPPRKYQDYVANILASLDKKIQANKKLNQTLEQIAQAIFKSWFVDFEPVKAKISALAAGGSEEDALLAAMQAISGKDKAQLTQLRTENPERYNELRTTAELFPSAMQDSELGEIPEGWEANPFENLLEKTIGGDWGKEKPDEKHKEEVKILRGTDLPNVYSGNDGKVPTRYVEAKKLKNRQLKPWDIVIEVSGGSKGQPTGRSLLITDRLLERLGRSEPASFCRMFRPINENVSLLLALHLQKIYADGKTWLYQNQSTGISNFQTKTFLSKEIVTVPPSPVQEAFFKMVNPLIERIYANESTLLGALRDALLPKLLSGEINIAEESNNQSTDEFNKES